MREDESSGSEDGEDNELPRVIRGESGLANKPTGLGKVLKVNVETRNLCIIEHYSRL